MKIAILAGDGIGPEIMAEARKALDALKLPEVDYREGDVGGAGYRLHGHPLPPETLARLSEDLGQLIVAIAADEAGASIPLSDL